jgi:hypothetical protein
MQDLHPSYELPGDSRRRTRRVADDKTVKQKEVGCQRPINCQKFRPDGGQHTDRLVLASRGTHDALDCKGRQVLRTLVGEQYPMIYRT